MTNENLFKSFFKLNTKPERFSKYIVAKCAALHRSNASIIQVSENAAGILEGFYVVSSNDADRIEAIAGACFERLAY